MPILYSRRAKRLAVTVHGIRVTIFCVIEIILSPDSKAKCHYESNEIDTNLKKNSSSWSVESPHCLPFLIVVVFKNTLGSFRIPESFST